MTSDAYATAAATPDPSARSRLRGLVTDILAGRMPARPIADDETLAEIGLASVDMVTLLLAIEGSFDIEVPPHEITPDTFRSIATLDAMLQRLRPPQSA